MKQLTLPGMEEEKLFQNVLPLDKKKPNIVDYVHKVKNQYNDNEPKSDYVEKLKKFGREESSTPVPTNKNSLNVVKALVKYEDEPREKFVVKYDPATGLFSNQDRDIAFKNYNEATNWNKSIGVEQKNITKEKPVRPKPFNSMDKTSYPSDPKQKRAMSTWDIILESAKNPKDKYDRENARQTREVIRDHWKKPEMRKYLGDDELKLIGKHKSQQPEPAPIIPSVPIPKFEPIEKDPRSIELENRFKKLVQDNEEAKIKEQNSGIAGLLGVKS